MARSAEGANREVCSGCGQPLVELPWSKPELDQRTYILTCVNIGCPRYRNPVKTVTREVAEIKKLKGGKGEY